MKFGCLPQTVDATVITSLQSHRSYPPVNAFIPIHHITSNNFLVYATSADTLQYQLKY